MPEETVEDLADIQQEGQPIELTEEKDTPADSPTEEKPVVEEPAEEGDNTPTEEDDDYKPKTSRRVKEILRERAELRDKLKEYEIREQVRKENLSPEEEVIPDRWSQLFSTGDPEQDREAYQMWKTLNEEEKASWKAEIIAEMRAEGNKEAEEQEQYAAQYEEQLDELEAEREEAKLPPFDRNALMKAISERPIFRPDGKPDFETALELMEAKKPGSSMGARKSLASLKPQGSVPDKGYKTPDDLKGGWSSI